MMTNAILCPTRGGGASIPNQDRAIAIAKERGVEVMFLYIVNVQFLGLAASPKLVDIEGELEEVGEFMLAMAQERADKEGVKSQMIVRRGVFQEVLKEVIEEFDIHTVVVGKSAGGRGVITYEYLRDLIYEVTGVTGVEFVVVHEGEIVDIYTPDL
jgi:nucleotide-binding universal stress UspA family protein